MLLPFVCTYYIIFLLDGAFFPLIMKGIKGEPFNFSIRSYNTVVYAISAQLPYRDGHTKRRTGRIGYSAETGAGGEGSDVTDAREGGDVIAGRGGPSAFAKRDVK